MSDNPTPTTGSAGGLARAERLTPEQRKEIAQRASVARWRKDIPLAPYVGNLKIGEKEIPCAVLEDGTRLISSAGFLLALGRPWRGKYRRTETPNFLAANNLKQYFNKELLDVLDPIEYRTNSGAVSSAFKAQLLRLVCNVYLKARREGKLRGNQEAIAVAAEIILDALAEVGIAALIDEATGYQDFRDRYALSKILERYLMTEGFRKWERMFQLDYYREMFRLKGWKLDPKSTTRPWAVAQITKNIVYRRIQPGILKKLEELNPRTATKTGSKRRARKHHQFFTGEVGVPELREHLSNVTFLMRSCRTWDEFISRIDVARPAFGDTLPLGLEYSD